MSNYHFFAIMSRMKYINRWSLMNNTRTENISEHSLTVAMIAHALCVINNKCCGGNANPEHAAALALFHDCTEIITGDLPTPIKYSSQTLRNAYADIENEASRQLLSSLPDYMRDEYEKLFLHEGEDEYTLALVKAADKLSALIKCIEEEQMGNNEFAKAKEECEKYLNQLHMPEVDIFVRDFLPSYRLSLDEQNIAL
ncbi:MAG: 5'-deoxynucleotidase [Clostridia bacterium]|nr:5'-deoxynucleotidase [Clostridia bacterium]